MRKRTWVAAIAATLSITSLAAQQPAADEEVRVNLVYVDATVTDSTGNTVAGLTKDDFVLSVGGKAREIGVFDDLCTAGPAAEPEANVEGRPQRPAVSVPEGHIVLVFDYHTIPLGERADVLEAARSMLARGKTGTERIMIVALADRVRIEQRFTDDVGESLETLQRMQYDLTLWGREFGMGVSGRSYFERLTTLMDVLGEYARPKAVVLFSRWAGRSDGNDLWFFDVAHHAAAARTAIYPVLTAGLQAGGSVGGPPGLSRLANESGGRTTFRTNDLSLAYARAQTDMACRYGIGFYVDETPARGQRVSLRLNRKGLSIRSPEQIKLFTEEEKLENRIRAAIVDPEHFRNPYIRAHAFPLTPRSKKSWDTLLALHFRMKVDGGGNDLDVAATLQRGVTPVGKFREVFRIEPATEGSSRSVTVVGGRKLKPGPHKLTVVVTKSGNETPQATTVEFNVPNVPDLPLVLRGPIVAKTVTSGVLIRTGEPDDAAGATLDAMLGEEGTIRPLLIHQIEPDDTLLVAWRVCSTTKKGPAGTAAVWFENDGGETVHELEPRPIDLSGKKRECRTILDEIPAGDLGAGEYRLRVAFKDASGEELATGLAPLRVR